MRAFTDSTCLEVIYTQDFPIVDISIEDASIDCNYIADTCSKSAWTKNDCIYSTYIKSVCTKNVSNINTYIKSV